MRFGGATIFEAAANDFAPNDSRKGRAMSAELLRRKALRDCFGNNWERFCLFIGQLTFDEKVEIARGRG